MAAWNIKSQNIIRSTGHHDKEIGMFRIIAKGYAKRNLHILLHNGFEFREKNMDWSAVVDRIDQTILTKLRSRGMAVRWYRLDEHGKIIPRTLRW